MNEIGKVIQAMVSYNAGDVRRINHFLKVYGYAKAIGELEGLDEERQLILEIAAVTHDIGIKNSEKKYQSAAGNYQQLEGPPEARKLLQSLVVEERIVDRVCWLIAHHHTYHEIDGVDYQILIEADFLVNAFEDALSQSAIRHMKERIFRTEAGTELLDKLYLNTSNDEK